MPGTITDEIEIIDAGHGGGTDVPAGGDDDGEGSGGSFQMPQRAYFTVIQLGIAGITMFFMALTSSFLVRKGLGNDWVAFSFPRILWGEYCDSGGQQLHHPGGTAIPAPRSEGGIQALVGVTDGIGNPSSSVAN